jgi:hypothetical protein
MAAAMIPGFAANQPARHTGAIPAQPPQRVWDIRDNL